MYFSPANTYSAKKEKKCPFWGEVFRESDCSWFKDRCSQAVEVERALERGALGLAGDRVGIPPWPIEGARGDVAGAELAKEGLGLHDLHAAWMKAGCAS